MASLGRTPGAAPLTSADIPDDSITGAKIVDDAIDSEHYAAGSVDAAHVAADVATQAEIDLKANLTSAALVTPDLGTPSAGVVTNLSGVLPVGVTGGTGLGGQQYCTAWTCYNASADTELNDFGLSSTTNPSTGVVRMTFTTELSSANYSFGATVGQLDTSSTGPNTRLRAQTTTYCEVTIIYLSVPTTWSLLNWIRFCGWVFGP